MAAGLQWWTFTVKDDALNALKARLDAMREHLQRVLVTAKAACADAESSVQQAERNRPVDRHSPRKYAAPPPRQGSLSTNGRIARAFNVATASSGASTALRAANRPSRNSRTVSPRRTSSS